MPESPTTDRTIDFNESPRCATTTTITNDNLKQYSVFKIDRSQCRSHAKVDRMFFFCFFFCIFIATNVLAKRDKAQQWGAKLFIRRWKFRVTFVCAEKFLVFIFGLSIKMSSAWALQCNGMALQVEMSLQTNSKVINYTVESGVLSLQNISVVRRSNVHFQFAATQLLVSIESDAWCGAST